MRREFEEVREMDKVLMDEREINEEGRNRRDAHESRKTENKKADWKREGKNGKQQSVQTPTKRARLLSHQIPPLP